MRARLAVAGMLLTPLGAFAAEPLPGDDVDIEAYGFFDYLGDMVEDEDGEWVDPLAMEALADDPAGQNEDGDGQPAAPGEDDDD